MAKYIYPAVFTPEDGGYSINFPDFESCYTSADTLEEGLHMANDVLCLTIYDMEESGQSVPRPSKITDVKTNGDEFTTLIECDTLAYQGSQENSDYSGMVKYDGRARGYKFFGSASARPES